MRYVEIGFVSPNRQITAVPSESRSCSAPLVTTFHAAGAVMRMRTRALRSGWSKQGKSAFASAGTRRV
jgi:hypothetical protein